MRIEIIKSQHPDIACLSKTHLKGDEEIYVEGYVFFGLNRQIDIGRVYRGSGGVGLLIKNELLANYSLGKIMKIEDNVISVVLTCKMSGETICVFSVYLPPENSKHGLNNEQVLNKLTIAIYDLVNIDYVFICGDFNARIGNKDDSLLSGSEMLKRKILDEVCNAQGTKLLEFVNNIRGCITNGRVTPNLDGFISLTSYRGKAVVDYFICRQTEYNIRTCEVKSCIEIIDEHNLQQLVGTNSIIPDHAMVCVLAELSMTEVERLSDKTLGSINYSQSRIVRRPGDNYMTSEVALKLLPTMLEQIDNTAHCQDEINKCYDNIVNLLLDESERSIASRKKKRRSTQWKAYWDLELSKKWKLMKSSEKLYRQMIKDNPKNTQLVTKLKKEFRNAQKVFDCTLNKKKRSYSKGLLLQMEACNTNDPFKFWNYVKKLGPVKKHKQIPWEVEIEGIKVYDKQEILDKWKYEFEKLYQIDSTEFDNSFKENMLTEKCKENITQDLNREITFREVEKVCLSAKNRKAVGIDKICNELVKCPEAITLLYHLFKLVMKHQMIPEMWRKAIIHPIPKGEGYVNDLLKYRGLALQYCIYKLLSSILNERIVKHLDFNCLLEEEQNGFCKGRSCQHHIFTLLSIIQNRMGVGKQTFCAFVNFSKGI